MVVIHVCMLCTYGQFNLIFLDGYLTMRPHGETLGRVTPYTVMMN